MKRDRQGMESPIKIGMLDSGVGGFSVLREILGALPGHPVHYVADNAWCPYGNKPARAIRARVFRITDHLIEAGAGMIVVACNSATIHAVEMLRATYPLPFVGMEPAVKPAAEMTETGIVGVLATEASIAGESFTASSRPTPTASGSSPALARASSNSSRKVF